MSNDLSIKIIEAALAQVDTGVLGKNLHYFEQVSSTNDIVRELASKGAPEGTLVIADAQTSGRGRMARSWIAPPGSALLMSLLFRPQLSPERIYRPVMACGLAIAESCEQASGQPAYIKWPNDVQIGGKKISGILPESALSSAQIDWIVMGMGINVNMSFPLHDPLAESAASIRTVLGTEFNRAELLAQVIAGIWKWVQKIENSALDEAWRGRCVTLGQKIQAETPSGKLVGTAEEIDALGALWLRLEDGTRQRLTISEASLHTES
jgi:BirA family biotin operon repressor/biotin-[acetyl-CoA-carboxylase] ligase